MPIHIQWHAAPTIIRLSDGSSIDTDRLARRWYDETTITVQGTEWTLPAGTFTDHTDWLVETVVYDLRDRRGENRWTHEQIAERLGLRHWRDSYNAARNLGRRRDGESGRDTNGALTYRSWNAPRNMRHEAAAPARPGSRPDQSLTARRFGIEIEYVNDRSASTPNVSRHEVAADLQRQGIRAESESYHHTVVHHWRVTTDATVDGEIVSPVMAGDTASLDEVRDVIRTVKAHGGRTGNAVGMHVHIDATDFTTADDRAHLVQTLRAAQNMLAAYPLQARIQGLTSCGARRVGDSEWDRMAQSIRNVVPGGRPSAYQGYEGYDRYVDINVMGPMNKYGTIEFRGLGGTLHAGKVRVWIRMCQAVVQAARIGGVFTGNVRQDVNYLVEIGLLGRRTASRYLAECERRGTIDQAQAA